MGCLKELRGQPKDSKGKDSRAKLMVVRVQQDLLQRKEQPPTELHAGILRAILVELESVAELLQELLMEAQDRHRLVHSPTPCPRTGLRRTVGRDRHRTSVRAHGEHRQRLGHQRGRRRLGIRRR